MTLALKSAITNYEELLETLVELGQKYNRPTEDLFLYSRKIREFKVTLPIVGAFSSGKSSLINALLEEKLLPVHINPETAVPTEIYYSSKERIEKWKNNKSTEIKKEELINNPFHVDTVDVIKVGLPNQMLSTIESIKIVDLPGLESDIAAHDKAVNNYLPESMAYIITVSAEDGTIRKSVLDFLRELNLLKMDVFIVITKADKKDVMEEGIYQEIKNTVSKTLHLNGEQVGVVSARKRDVKSVRDFLEKMQEKAVDVFYRNYKDLINTEIANLEKYLVIRLDNENVSLADIDREEQKLREQLSQIREKMEREKSLFLRQVDNCIHTIRGKITSGLSGIADLLVQDILSNLDVKSRIQQVVRASVIEGIKSDFEPKLQKYLRNIHDSIPRDISINTQVGVNATEVKMEEMVKDTVIRSIPYIITAIGVSLTGPVGILIGGAVTLLVELFYGQKSEERKRDAVKLKVNSELIPSVSQSAGDEFSLSLRDSIEKISEEIEKGIEKQQAAILEGLETLRAQKQMMVEEQEKVKQEIKLDLEKINQLYEKISPVGIFV